MHTTPATLFDSRLLRLDTLSSEQIERLLRKPRQSNEQGKSRNGSRLFCTACHHCVTCENERIPVLGHHEHHFSNPHGITFRIGCFATAPGCVHHGPSTEQWTWFPGYCWRIAVCARCAAHLGWRYSNPSGNHFHGLILRQLTRDNGND